jgi:hypothetical protein
MKKMKQREQEVITLDEEERILEDIERDLEEAIRYLWHRTREMADHDGWRDVQDPLTGEWYCTGCDCNRWNRIELIQAIRRLRAFRQGIYLAY